MSSHMYTEIIKIIEGGMRREPVKVVQFARKLADIFDEEGNARLAKGIRKVIDSGASNILTMEQLTTTAPVDSETRMSIVDIFNPSENDFTIILPEIIERKVMDFIKIVENKDKIKSLGLPMQSSLLLYGIPGEGKTTIAKYISIQTKLPLVTARLDALISSLLGNTSKNIRKIFEYADSKPCILFLDEFDAIAKARDDEHEMGELKRVINSLLQNIDIFSQNNILIAATNHPELLDKAIWRRSAIHFSGSPVDMAFITSISLDVRPYTLVSFSRLKSPVCRLRSGTSLRSAKFNLTHSLNKPLVTILPHLLI